MADTAPSAKDASTAAQELPEVEQGGHASAVLTSPSVKNEEANEEQD